MPTIRLPSHPRAVRLEDANPWRTPIDKLRALPSSEFGVRLEYYDAGERGPAPSVSDSSAAMAEAAKKPVGHPPDHKWDEEIWPVDAYCSRKFIEKHGREPNVKERHAELIKAMVPSYDTFRKAVAAKEAVKETSPSANETPQS